MPQSYHQSQYAPTPLPQQGQQQASYQYGAPQYQQHAPNQAYSQQPQQNRYQQPQQQISVPKTAPPLDLLTSPLDVTLPSQDPHHAANLPAPPIPPNPQKDAILTALSQSLNHQLTNTLSSNAAAASSLRSQNQSLSAALAHLQSELRDLDALDAQAATNEAVLRDAMRDADRVMADASARRRPEIDDVLVAPTVVGNQLYREAAEISGLVEARVVLGKALDRGGVGTQEWSRVVRALAREEFGKRALVKKIARGMGLEGGEGVRGDAFYGGEYGRR